MLIIAEPNTLSHITRYSTSQHMEIKTVEITVRVNSQSWNYSKLSPKTVSAAQTTFLFLSSSMWHSFEFTKELSIPVMDVTSPERQQSTSTREHHKTTFISADIRSPSTGLLLVHLNSITFFHLQAYGCICCTDRLPIETKPCSSHSNTLERNEQF